MSLVRTPKDILAYVSEDRSVLLLLVLIVVSADWLAINKAISGDDAIKLYSGIIGYLLGSSRAFKRNQK